MTHTLYSFGYQGLKDADDLREMLRATLVETVVDCRLSPYSGNRAFSLGTRHTVEEAGRRYVHMKGLGNLGYKRGTIEIADIEAIEIVLQLLQSGPVALMCVCASPDECHRLTLCEEAVRRQPDLKVVHLTRRPALDAGPTDMQLQAFADALLPTP